MPTFRGLDTEIPVPPRWSSQAGSPASIPPNVSYPLDSIRPACSGGGPLQVHPLLQPAGCCLRYCLPATHTLPPLSGLHSPSLISGPIRPACSGGGPPQVHPLLQPAGCCLGHVPEAQHAAPAVLNLSGFLYFPTRFSTPPLTPLLPHVRPSLISLPRWSSTAGLSSPSTCWPVSPPPRQRHLCAPGPHSLRAAPTSSTQPCRSRRRRGMRPA